jgi:hypothetical protein
VETFNNREIAIGVWTIATIVFAATKKSIRSAFWPVLTAFYNKLILIPLGLMGSYIVLVVIILNEMGLWDVTQLKNTLLWSISVATVSLFRIPQIAEDERYFKKAIKDNFKIVAVFEFVVTFYTFPLWFELIVVPASTILVATQIYAESKKEYAAANGLLTKLLTAFGWGLVIYVVYKLITDFGAFARMDTLSEFALPIVLSLLFLPFTMVLAMYVSYEKAFARLNFFIKDVSLRQYGKKAALFGFHIQKRLLKRWVRDIGMYTPATRRELDVSIARVKACAMREKRAIPVPLERGWSPYRAREFLIAKELVADDYHQVSVEEFQWIASAPYFKIGKGILADFVTYEVEGDEQVVHRLTLVVTFNNQETTSETREQFRSIAEELFQKALDQAMPLALCENIMTDTPISLMISGKVVGLSRKAWTNGQHELRLTIRNATSA